MPGIAERLDLRPGGFEGFEVGGDAHQVDDGLGGYAGDRRRADMVHFGERGPHRLEDAAFLATCLLRP